MGEPVEVFQAAPAGDAPVAGRVGGAADASGVGQQMPMRRALGDGHGPGGQPWRTG